MTTETASSPFSPQHALNKEQLSKDQADVSQSLTASRTQISYVPGQPSVSLASSDVHEFLIQELRTSALDELDPRFSWVGRKDSTNVDPLNHQIVKGRKIVPTEDPKLHLVWERDKIYIKPIPVCFLNYDFWEVYLPRSQNSTISDDYCSNRFAAIGFMRSYSHLIQHRLDFVLAQQNHLLPGELEWIEWSTFIACFRRIDDSQVALWYHYGQLRLSRLNWAVRVFQPRAAPTAWFYHIPDWSTTPYLEDFLGPLIFMALAGWASHGQYTSDETSFLDVFDHDAASFWCSMGFDACDPCHCPRLAAAVGFQE
ncbi:MAG: hypothetical protein Q9195_004855 [Heterodermia aff. obscurata]